MTELIKNARKPIEIHLANLNAEILGEDSKVVCRISRQDYHSWLLLYPNFGWE